MQPPIVSSTDTIFELLKRSGRPWAPIRRAFVQRGSRASAEPGPLAEFVRAHDDRALELYLLCLAGASKEPWDVRLAARVWARALTLEDSASSRSAISKIWRRLEARRLIARERINRTARVQLLREDGSGQEYTHPGRDTGGRGYFKLPHAFWTAAEGWYRALALPEIAVLLIALSLSDDFALPYDRVPTWYGISAGSAERGLLGLHRKGLLDAQARYRKLPLSPTGYVEERRYTLRPPFGPHATERRPAAS